MNDDKYRQLETRVNTLRFITFLQSIALILLALLNLR